MLDFDNTLKFDEPLSFHQAKEQSNGRRFVVYPLMLSIPLICFGVKVTEKSNQFFMVALKAMSNINFIVL